MKNHVSDYRKQNYFLRIFFALFLFTCIVVETHGQSEEGDSMSNPIVVGEHGDSFSFSSIKGTALFTDQYTVRSQKDIIYRFTITRPMIMTLSHCGSSYVLDTYMHLLDSSGDYIQTSDYSFGDGACSSSQQAFIQLPLNAGTYYVVSELGDENEEGSDGVIKTNIDGYSYDFNYQSAPSGYSTDLEAVGSINGAFDVSAMGGATYSIPIDVPQGVGGMQPGLALVYNSQAGNGLAGWGCNLSGISVITRAPKDIYHDGAAKGLTHMANEAYLLDGQRLIYVSGTAGQNGAIYSPESDPFTQVIVHGTDTVWFEVHASNGMKYYFGNTTSARQSYTAGSSSRINAWYLDYAEDPLGNYMDYTYQMAGFFVYPNSIIYGKNQNVTGSFQNTVTFTYESRSDSTHFVLEGVKGSMGKRLKTITCKTGNEVYRTYNLQYNNTGDASTTKFSRLISVTEKNGAGEALKPTVLNWSYLPAFSQDVSATTVTNGGSVSFDNHSFIAMDHNGDGLTDMTGFFTSGTRTVARVYLASLDTYGNVQFTANGTSNDYNVGPSDRIMAILKSLTDKDYLLTDFDGDGVSELILTEMGSRIIHCTRLEDADEGNSLYIDYRQSRSEIPLFAAEDLNNDGRGEIIILERNPNGPTPCTIVNVQDTIFLGLSFPSKPDKMFVSDYNGDGLKDILVFYGGGKSAVKGYTIFWNQGDGISSTTFSDSHKTIGTNIAYAWMIREGDFNGDGLPDFIMNASYTNQWYFALNNGNGTFTKQLACTLEIYDQGTSSDNDKFTCLVYDFDFDGKSDVVINKAMYGTTPVTHTYWMRSNGDSLNVKIHSTSNRDVDAKSSHYVLGDFNGDGQVELVNYGYNCASGTNNTNPSSSWHLYKNSNYNVNRGKITSITNGYGATTTINYASLANGGIYTKGSGSTYPIVDYTLPVHAVKTVTANGMTVNYRYGGIKAHLRGRGLIGMMSQKATNTTLNTVTESGISGINVSFYLPNETYTKTIVNGDTAKVTTQITFAPKGTTKYFAYPSSKTEKDLDGNINYTTYQYNTAYGYITEEKTRYNTNNDQMHKTIQYGNYVLAGGAYKPRLIIQTQRHADDTATFTQKKYITYDTTRGYQTQVIENYDTSLPLTTNYTYDDFGNVLTSQTTGSGITPITNIVEYDATKRFVTKTYTSPASEVQTYTYNIWGNVLTENDETNTSNILTTAHTYDNWGNRKTTSFLDSLRISYHSGWNNNNSKRFFTLIQKKGQPWVKTWYDNLGREVLTESRGPKSMIIKTAKTYNNKGQLTQEQNQQGNLTITQSYTYDIYGRVASSSSTAGQSATYGYGNRRDTVTTNGRTYIKTYDAWGNIKTSSDPASSVSYTYNSQGKPKTVTTGGATFSMTYYNTGLQHTLVDPNAGTTTYVYDAAGRMTQQTDGRGKVTTNTYDALGRLASSMCGGASGLVNYTYGTSGNEKLRLTRIQQGSYYIAYTHDSQGRVVTEKRKVPGITATLDFSYAYNPAGQVSSITYPEGVQISRQYDSYGNLEKVKYGTQNIWELIGATGRVTTTKLGGTMTSTKTLSTQGLLTGQQTVLGSNTLHNMTYVFNAATGNLSSRTGMTGATTTEGFTYDNLDRLTTVTHNGASVMDISYYANGNIDFKTGLGEYSYLATKPHALKSVDNTDGLVPSTRQSISYTNFNKVSSISELDEKANGGVYSMTFDYGPTRERWRTILNS
ncbi:FG-GAP-like repeat-containing protein, partial [Viscerimonas tarda]